MTAREFRCRECRYPFKTPGDGAPRHVALMCPACGSTDLEIILPPRRTPVTRLRAVQRNPTEKRD